jgi:hypothetical protein
MKKYKVENLSATTPQSEQGKLITALKAVSGVQSAVLHPSSSEFEIKARTAQQPKRKDLAAAASEVGFALITND